jgi:hypothetical protein
MMLAPSKAVLSGDKDGNAPDAQAEKANGKPAKRKAEPKPVDAAA